MSESRELLTLYKLPNFIDNDYPSFSKQQWNSLVKEAVNKKSECDLKKQFLGYSKLNKKNISRRTFAIKGLHC